MRFQPSTLKQASLGPSSQLWVDCCEARPCPLGSQPAGSSPATSVASRLSHATADGHSLTPGGWLFLFCPPPTPWSQRFIEGNQYIWRILGFLLRPPLFLWMSLSAMLNRNHTRNGVLRLSCWDTGFPLLPTPSVCTFQRFQDWPQRSLSTWQTLLRLLLGSRASCSGLPLVCRISPAKIPKPADLSEPAKAQRQLHCPVPGGPGTIAAGSPASTVHPRAWRKENCQIDFHLSEESPAHHLKTQQSWAVNGPECSGNTTGALHREAYSTL